LEGTELLPKRFHSVVEADNSEKSWAISVALDEVLPLHQAATANWQSLRKSRELTSSYLTAADNLIDGLWGGRLDQEECSMIRDALGEPPTFCLPIYVVTIRNEQSEEVIYVGKTTSSTRFSGGHHVALKLHAPEFSNFSKQIYRCSVLLYLRDEYLALEWLDSDNVAEGVLDLTESVLIYALQPKLNSAKLKSPRTNKPIHIHVQNYADTLILDDLMLEFSKDTGLMVVPSKGSSAGNLGILKRLTK
jgi:hypothetical protein